MLASLFYYTIFGLKILPNPKNKRRPAPVFLFCIKIKGMDKIIKTISESGSFRAFVLDSTETVRAAQEYHQTQAKFNSGPWAHPDR